MSRIRSVRLYRFLKENGGLHNPREERRLRKEYRRRYQNRWARQNRKKHEIRFTLSRPEYAEIKAYSQTQSTTPTELARELLIAQAKTQGFLPNKKELLSVAKQLGLAINRLHTGTDPKAVVPKLLEAEQLLLNYLNP